MYAPVDDIIPRKADPAVEELMGKLNTVISSFVDFGSNILKWDTEVRRVEAYNTPIMMSFRHFLELTDSISILIKESSVDPCKIILRGMLETYFSLEYLFKEDTANRGMAFLVWHLHEKIKACEDADPTTERGKQLRKRLSKDKFTNNVKLPIEADPKIQAKKTSFEKLLQEPDYQKAEQEYQRLRNQGEKNPPWYRLFNGPPNLVEMAERLELMGIYDNIYRHWSGPTHGIDIIQGKASVTSEGSAEIFQIRHFGSVNDVGFSYKTICFVKN